MVPRLFVSFLLPLLAAASSVAQTQPADAIAGQWRSDAQFVIKDASQPTPAYFWVGNVDAHISPTGRIQIRSGNGCSATGLLAPLGATGKYRGAINLTRCSEKLLNRSYNLDAASVAGTLKLSATTKEIVGGKVRAMFDVSTTLARR